MKQQRAIAWSYGGGTQSIAIALLIVQGRLPKPDITIMADTGREATETWEYHEAYTKPLLASVGVEVLIAGHELATVDLYGKNGDMLMPLYTQSGKLPTNCSTEWKQRPFRRLLRQRGYGPKNPVTVWLGMSLDEVERLKHSDKKWCENHWPLCFDVPMTRGQCADLVRAFGWPDPPKSSCWMCSHRRNPQWERKRSHYPADWQKACAMDVQQREYDTRHAVYLHESRVPLAEADLSEKPSDQLPLLGCDTGFCWT